MWKNKIAEITDLFEEIKSLYIADGHHRSASAYKVALKRREENPGFTGDENLIFLWQQYFLRVILKYSIITALSGI